MNSDIPEISKKSIYPSPETLEHHPVVPREQWLVARTELLKEEKEFTRLRDKINARRRDLPWVRVEKNYVFHTLNGPQTLADLFEGRSQLFVSISCSLPDGRRVAWAVRLTSTISKALSCTSSITT